MKQLDPNYMLVKFHDYSIIRLGFRDHSSHPNLTEKKLKSQKNLPNPRTELMGVPLTFEKSRIFRGRLTLKDHFRNEQTCKMEFIK